MANEQMKICSTYVKGNYKLKMRYYYTSSKMAKSENTDNYKCWRGCGVTGTSIHWL